MKELYFADIPVYRLEKEEYEKSLAEDIDKKMYGDCKTPKERETRKAFFEKEHNLRTFLHDRLWKNYGGQWRFNEIIGYVRLHFLGFQVRGELFMVDKMRIRKTRKKLLMHKTHKVAPELEIYHDASNKEIFKVILQYIADAKRELRPKFLDSSLFELLGKHVDWRKLLNMHNSNR